MAALDDISYELPEELIAVRPPDVRGQSRLLTVDRTAGILEDHQFDDILDLLQPGDLLVLNETAVFNARLYGTTGGRSTEALLVEPVDGRRWKAMLRNAKKIKEGSVIGFGDLQARMTGKGPDGLYVLEFSEDATLEVIGRYGRPPLPPYIIKKRAQMKLPEYFDDDSERYQSVFARNPGSVAAPTASLHFTPRLLQGLAAKGVDTARVLLHVGPGTFRTVNESLDDFEIHEEWIEVPETAVTAMRECRGKGGRIIAVGTTSVRAIETMAFGRKSPADWRPFSGYTRLFIKDNFKFNAADALITNFHMPHSTLLLLVQSFGGRDLLKRAYAHAIEQKYRFLSYGDAMFIHQGR